MRPLKQVELVQLWTAIPSEPIPKGWFVSLLRLLSLLHACAGATSCNDGLVVLMLNTCTSDK